MILLDTDHLSILVNARASTHGTLLRRMEAAGTEFFGVPVVAAEEQCRGWLAEVTRQRDVDRQVLAYDNLAKLFDFLGHWAIVRFDTRAATEFKALRKQLRRMGTQDLKIAAIALANGALLLSANLRDFRQVPGLRVDNWLD
jgi:tRNA(fMet)-specific endonuclease VapC